VDTGNTVVEKGLAWSPGAMIPTTQERNKRFTPNAAENRGGPWEDLPRKGGRFSPSVEGGLKESFVRNGIGGNGDDCRAARVPRQVGDSRPRERRKPKKKKDVGCRRGRKEGTRSSRKETHQRKKMMRGRKTSLKGVNGRSGPRNSEGGLGRERKVLHFSSRTLLVGDINLKIKGGQNMLPSGKKKGKCRIGGKKGGILPKRLNIVAREKIFQRGGGNPSGFSSSEYGKKAIPNIKEGGSNQWEEDRDFFEGKEMQRLVLRRRA